jgi:predicted RND superfamily exporter protein
MQNYTNFIDKYKKFIIIFTILSIAMLSISMKNLAFEGNFLIWFDKDSKIVKDYHSFTKIFGNSDGVIVAFQDKNGIFTKKALSSVDRITQKFSKMKYVVGVTSITNFPYISVNPNDSDDIIIEEFIQDISNQDDKYFKNKKQLALDEKLILNNLISSDGTTTMISARLQAGVGDKEDISFEIMKNVKKILNDEKKITNYKYHIGGGASITSSFVKIATKDGGTFTPMVMFCIVVLLFIIFRKWSGAMVPLAVISLAILVVVSMQILLGYKMNNFTANISVFIAAIGIADAVHIYIVWMMHKKDGSSNIEAITSTLQQNMLPIFLTSLTTAIGFASLMVSSIVPIVTFGIATASGAVVAFILSITFMPALLLTLDENHIQKTTKKKISQSFFHRFDYGAFIIKNNIKILVLTIGLFLVFGFGLTKVQVDNNLMKYFDKNVPVRVMSEFVMKNLRGPMSYEIVLDTKNKDGIKQPDFMKTVDKFYIQLQDKYPQIRHLSSLLDTVKKLNQVMHGDKKEYYKVPDSKNTIAQYLLFYTLSLPQGQEINDKMNISQSKLRISASVDMSNSSKDLEINNWIVKWWENTPYSASIQGKSIMAALMQVNVLDTLTKSLSMALVFITIMMFILLKNIKKVIIFLLPNILPIVLVVGVMGWLGIYIDMGVAISGAIVLGVATDDTIHFLMKYRYIRKSKPLKDSLNYVLKYAGLAILVTTIILISSFSLFLGSDFLPNFNFAIVTSVALFVALLCDILFLPALLSLVDNDDKSNK